MVRVRASQHFKVKTDHRGIIPSLLLKIFSRFSANRWQKLNFCVLNRYTVTKLCILDSSKKINIVVKKQKKMVFGFGMFHIVTPLLLEIQFLHKIIFEVIM